MTIGFAPLVPWPALAALGLLTLAAIGLMLARRARGAWLRLTAMAALLAALAGPHMVVAKRRPLPDIALVAVDRTLSQTIDGRAAQTDRAEAAVRAELARLPGLQTRVITVRNSRGGDRGTRLFAAIRRALAELPRRRLAGIVTITDGLVDDVPPDLGRGLGAPVQVLLTGRPGERDRRVVVKRSPPFAMVGHDATIRFAVDERGARGDAPITVRVDGKSYFSDRVPLNRTVSITIPIRHAGRTVVEMTAAPAPGEVSLANNTAALAISGVRDRLKVLLISGKPNAGERAWRNLLKSDPAVELVHFTILRSPDKEDDTPIRDLSLIAFPVRELFEDKLKDFDLVIFDRYSRRGVLPEAYYRRLVDYVRGGGALLMVAGPEFAGPLSMADTPLAAILPGLPTGRVELGPFLPRVTAVGRRHPVTADLPGAGGANPSHAGGADGPHWGPWLRQIDVRRRAGVTVLSGKENQPLLILNKVGKGRIAELLSDTVWLWARGWRGGGPYNELLRRVAHWLMREPALNANALEARVQGTRILVTRRSLAPPTGPDRVTVTRPDGTTLDLALTDHEDGRATGALTADQAGVWRVTDGRRTAIAVVGSQSAREFADLAATARRLAPVAAATGGSIRWLVNGGVPPIRRVAAGAEAAGRDWIGLERRNRRRTIGLSDVPLFPAFLFLALVLGGLAAAWRREGR